MTGQAGIGTSLLQHVVPCSHTHNMQANLPFCFFLISLAMGSLLPYSAVKHSTFSLKVAYDGDFSGGLIILRGNFGRSQILTNLAYSHVHRFNGLVGRTADTLSMRPLRQRLGGNVAERSAGFLVME